MFESSLSLCGMVSESCSVCERRMRMRRRQLYLYDPLEKTTSGTGQLDLVHPLELLRFLTFKYISSDLWYVDLSPSLFKPYPNV